MFFLIAGLRTHFTPIKCDHNAALNNPRGVKGGKAEEEISFQKATGKLCDLKCSSFTKI